MKVYRGKRHGRYSDVTVVVVDENGERPLRHRVHHSPDGFEWGYGGSGPADLARSLCWDLLGHQPASAVYQQIKWQFVAHWGDEWEISESVLMEAIERIEEKER